MCEVTDFNFTNQFLLLEETADLFVKNKETLKRWDIKGILTAVQEPVSNYRIYRKDDVQKLLGSLLDENFDDNVSNMVFPAGKYKVLELFAGAGGLALGLEKAGLHCVALNEIDPYACKTLHTNRPNWQILQGDVKKHSFKDYQGEVDVVTGGFPCQAFSYAGKKLGLDDARKTYFMSLQEWFKKLNPPYASEKM